LGPDFEETAVDGEPRRGESVRRGGPVSVGLRRLALSLVALVAISACESSADTDTGDSTVSQLPTLTPIAPVETSVLAPPIEAPEPGELVWIHDREPADLHFDDPDNGADIAGWIREGLLEGLFGVDQSISYYPELLAGEPSLTVNNNGTVTIVYELRPDLRWSDGETLTADDVAYTHRIIIEGCELESDGSIVDATNVGCEYDMANRIGYDLITGFEVSSPTSFTVELASFFPGWRNLYPQIYAEHAFGIDATSVNNNIRRWRGDEGLLPSSGPLVFDSWDRGVSLRMVRNEQYHGSVSPDVTNRSQAQVESVKLVFVTDRETQIEMLSDGLAHLLVAQLHPDLAVLAEDPGFTVASVPGPLYEHWGLNLLNPHLSKPEVREAIAYALDKSAIISELYQPLVGEALDPSGLGNAYWMPGQAAYVDHQAEYQGNNVAAAASALQAAGYEKDSEGIWTHPDDGRLTIRLGTTAGNAMRDQALEIGRSQLAAAGIDAQIESAPGGLFLTEGPFAAEALEASGSEGRSGNSQLWDIAQFGWSSGPWPGAATGVFRSGSGSNPYGFSSPEFDVAATDCDGTADDAERAACYNELDLFVTTLEKGDDGLFVIPLTQRPVFYGFAANTLSAGAVAPGGPRGGPLVNVVDFALS
jgi:peptide/nickel transport system substrate-binding protein